MEQVTVLVTKFYFDDVINGANNSIKQAPSGTIFLYKRNLTITEKYFKAFEV